MTKKEQAILDASVEAIMKAIRESGQDKDMLLKTLQKANTKLKRHVDMQRARQAFFKE